MSLKFCKNLKQFSNHFARRSTNQPTSTIIHQHRRTVEFPKPLKAFPSPSVFPSSIPLTFDTSLFISLSHTHTMRVSLFHGCHYIHARARGCHGERTDVIPLLSLLSILQPILALPQPRPRSLARTHCRCVPFFPPPPPLWRVEAAAESQFSLAIIAGISKDSLSWCGFTRLWRRRGIA